MVRLFNNVISFEFPVILKNVLYLPYFRYEGFDVVSPNEFEVVLYLNQMGVFNFVDDGSLPGCAVLKLSDGRKR